MSQKKKRILYCRKKFQTNGILILDYCTVPSSKKKYCTVPLPKQKKILYCRKKYQTNEILILEYCNVPSPKKKDIGQP